MMDLDVLVLVSRALHIAAVVAAVGGAVFLRWIFTPALRESAGDEEARQRINEAVRVRWCRLVFGCIAVLLLTGFANFFLLAIRSGVPAIPYHAIFGPKLLAAMFVFFVASALAGRSPAFANMRKARTKWLSILLVVSALIIVASGILNQVRTAYTRQASEPAAHSVLSKSNPGTAGTG